MKTFKEFLHEGNYQFHSYMEFLNEAIMPDSFKRFYMLVNKPYTLTSTNPIGKEIGTVRDMLFNQVSITNEYKNLSFDKDIPILNFNNKFDIVNSMLNDGIIDKIVLYNSPNECILSSNKVEFHKRFENEEFMPNTVFTQAAAYNLNFPIISKPKNGSSAKGIKKFNNIEELKSSDEEFDVFSEMIDIKKEYRCFCFNRTVLVLNERITEDGSKKFLDDTETETDFKYKEIDLNDFDKLNELNKIIDKSIGKIALDFYSLDFAEDVSGNLYLIEINSGTGMGVDKMIKLYKAIYKDFYNEDIDNDVNMKFNELLNEWYKIYK